MNPQEEFPTSDWIDERFERFFDGTIGAAEAERLYEILENNSQWSERFVHEHRDHFLFRLYARMAERPLKMDSGTILSIDPRHEFSTENVFAAGVTDLNPESFDTAELARLAAASPALPKTKTEPESRKKPAPTVFAPKESKSWLSLKILAPLLLAAFGAAIYFEFHPVPEEVLEADDPFGPFPARITELVDATFEETILPLKKDERLEAGPVSLLAGIMEIEYKNGVRVVLEGPAKYHIETPMEAACDLGRLSIFVPPEGKGFSVMTPKMTVRDLGTAFFMDVDAEKTQLHVVEGEVEANWLTKDWLPFKAGRGVEREEGKDVRNFVAEIGRYVDRTRVQALDAVRQREIREDWEQKTETLQRNPSLVLKIDDSWKKGPADSFAKVPGPWPGKSSIALRRPSDRIVVDVPKELRSFTMLATIRIDRINGRFNTIFGASELRDGSLFWQVNHDGRLQLIYRPPDREAAAAVDLYESPPVVTPGRIGVSFHVAVVFDAVKKTVEHYVDGRLVATRKVNRDSAVRPGRAYLGNSGIAKSDRKAQHLNGTIDDFHLFDRPLTPEEIQELFQ